MKNVIAIKNTANATAAGPRKINDLMKETDDWPGLTPLFDEFWREGELALMFGASGTGKSILAMQIADALARGNGVDGFSMPASGKRVLYVDLQHADFQFKARYRDRSGRQYTFSERIFRCQPPGDVEDLAGWLREKLTVSRFDVVIIDDIGSLKRTADGVRETLSAMRELRRLRDEMKVSILVLADAAQPRRKYADESDLGSSRVLCTVADSVFALSSWDAGQCRVIQMRSRNSAVVWTPQIAPVARITRLKAGMLGFQFDERFIPELSSAENELAQQIRAMKEAGRTFRQISDELGVSKTRAHNLLKRSNRILRLRELGEEAQKQIRRRKLFDDDDGEYYDADPIVIADTFPGCEEYDKAREHERFEVLNDDDESPETDRLRTEFYELQLARSEAMEEYKRVGRAPKLEEMLERIRVRQTGTISDVDSAGEPSASKPKTIYDLPLVIDKFGKKMYVEKEQHYTRKPEIFYTVNSSGQVTRWVRRVSGVFGTQVKDANLAENEGSPTATDNKP